MTSNIYHQKKRGNVKLHFTGKHIFLCLFFIIASLGAFAQVTVNPGAGNYATVNAAFTAINAGTHTGAITVEISANTTEPAAPVLLAASGVGSANYTSISIYPTATGVVVSGASSASRGVLEFNGSDNITINGNLNNGVGASRDLTIQNTTAITNAHTILWFQSSTTSPQLGCTNIVVKNTKLIGNADVSQTRTGTTPFQPSVVFSTSTFPGTTTVTAVNNSNITFDNNEILRGFGGLHIGQATTAALTGLTITNNIIGSNTAADYIIWRAMFIANCTGALIQGNTVQNIRSIISSSSGAIELSGATGANNTVRKNLIRGISNISTGGWASAGIYVISGNSNTTIDNNVIYDLQGANYSSAITTFNTYGIRLTSGTGHKVWYNSVNLYGTINSGATASASTAIAITATTVTGLDIRNNIFSNLHVSTANGYQAFCIRFASGYPYGTAANIINNNYYGLPASNTSTTSYFVGGTYAAGVTYANLPAMQTATGYDSQSGPIVNIPAPFTANNNLVIPASTSTTIESGGVAIAALGLPNTDYTGVNRPAGTGTAPDMGAYEFEGVAASGCGGTPSNGGTASASSTSICTGSGVTVSATGYTSDIGIQYNWQSSTAVGGPFSDIGGATNANSYATGTLSSDMYYRLRVTCTNSSLSNYSTVIGISVNNPQISSTAPASRCGTGTVSLGATPTAGTINWYTALTGGTAIATGNTYVTPVISNTTTYYVTASSGGTTQTSSNGVPTVGTSTSNAGLEFTLNTNVVLNSIQVYSTTVDNLVVTIENSSSVILFTSPSTPIIASTLSNPQTINLGWSIPAGVGYRIKIAHTGSGLGYATGAFPAPMGNGVGTITNGWSGSSTSTLNYFVYNMNTTSGCESSPRTAVTATVTPAPTIIPASNQSSVCSGAPVNLSVTSSNDPNYNYTWTSTPAGFTASGANITANPTVTTTYNVTANDPGTQCQALGSISVTALPAAPAINGNPSSICANSGSSILSLVPATGYGSGTIEWENSPDGITYTPIPGASGTTYTTPTITTTTYYKAVIKDVAGNICNTPTQSIVVGIPTVNSTTPNTRCGTGTTTLQATGSAGATIKWYTGSTGGSTIGTGSPFTTPLISNTTTYYAAAETGSTPINATIGIQTTTTQAGMPFRAGNATAFRTQYLYTATELATAGLSAGTWNEFKWTVTTAVGAGSGMGNLTIRVGHTGVSALTATFQPSPATIVYGPTNYIASGALGDMTFTFVSPFNWDGSSNVLIEVCHANPSPTGVSGQVAANTTGFVSVAAVANVCGTAAGATTQSIRPVIKIAGSTGCSSARTAVTATVTPAPAITVSTTTLAICPGGNADISVSSPNDPDYSYSWTSSPAGFTASGAGPHTVSPTVTTKYYVTAMDNSGGANQGCAMIDSVIIINGGTLVAGTVSASQSTLCVSGSSILTLAGASGGANQWQSSIVSSSGPWTNVGTGAVTYNTGTITQTTYYQVVTSCNSSSVTSNAITITVNNPQVLSTAPATRCGTGTVTLGATLSAGATAKWYTTSTGGTAIASGTSYTTPSISTTTNYYVSSTNGGGGSLNVASPTATTSTFFSAATGWGLRFSVNTACTINSVEVVASNATAGAATMQIKVTDLTDAVLYTGTLHNFTIGTTLATYVIPVNISIAPGTNYKMVMTSTGINNLVRESSGVTFPYNSPGNEVSITAGANGVTTAQTTTAYYWFYNWIIATGCESARTMVTATVNPAPAISLIAGDPGLCTGGSTTLQVSSANDPDYTYTWTSNPAGFSQTGNGPFTISPSVTTKYFVSAVDNSGGSNNGCVISDSVNVIVTGTLVAGTASASQTNYCLTGTPTLTLAGSQGAIQWQQSTVSATGPWTNVGTGLTTYTPTLTQTTYIQAVVSCQSSSLTSNVVTINVNNPSITGTTPNSRCGAGTVNLGATPSAGTIVNWYTASTGGSPIATGNTFATPVIGSTTTYYAAANSGGGSTQVSSNGVPTVTTSTQNGGLQFTLNVDVVLNSIQVYSSAAGTATVTLENSANTVLYTSAAMPITNSGLSVPQTLTLGWAIPAGVGYHIKVANTGNALGYASGAFPAPMGNGVGTITNGWLGSSTSTLNYFVYNMNTTTGCESARTAVTATVTASPSITASATFTTPCAGNPTDLSVSSSNAGYNYSWTSTPAGFNQTGAGPLTATPSVTTTYQVLASDNSGGAFDGCGALATVVVTPTANPLTVNAGATPSSICPGESAQLNTSATTATGIAAYTFTSTTSAYTPVLGGTVLASGAWDDVGPGLNIPLGFTFNYNGVSYTTCNINLNGYISFGTTTTNNNFTPISTLVTNEAGVVAAFARDLEGLAATGEIRYLSSGGVFTIQWTDSRRFHTLANAEVFSFQLKLYQNTNQIRFVYGNFSNAISAETATLPQIGLRGTTTSDYKNLQVLSGGNWSAPTLGTANTQTCYYNEGNTATKPSSGLTYIFSPPSSGGITYDWSTNSNFLSATNIANPVAQAPTSTQTYTVVVTQASTGCTKSATQTVTLKPAPDLSTSGGGVACEGNGISLSVSNNAAGQSSGNTYAWTTDASIPFTSTQQTPNVTGSSVAGHSGNYTVVVTNSFLCTASAVEVVTVNPNPVLSIVSTQNVGCVGGSDGSITVGATGGLANYDFTSDFVNFINDPAQATIINLPAGNTTVYVSDANGCNSQISANLIAVSSTPPSASVILPFVGMPTNVCNGTTATLSIPAVSNTTMYIWDAPGAAYFNGNPLNVSPFTTSTPSVTITYSNPGGSLYVTGVQAANGCGATVRKVQKTRGTISVPASVSGSTTACANTTGTYSTGAVDAASSYQWTITGDATVSGTGTTATVTFGPAWNGGTLCVAAKTSCYTSPTKCITIGTSASMLNAISGAFTACPNTTLSYSVPPSTGAASYTWTLPAGSTGTSTTNSINVTYGPGYSAVGSICVSVTSVCGVTSAIKCKTVAPGLPGQPSSITGALTGLCNQTRIYSCPSQGAGTTYNWTSPGSINSGQGSTSISTTFGALSTGNVCVTASNSCGSSIARCVPVKGAPNAPGAITATPSSWCANTPGIEFTVNTSALTGSYTLNWAYPPATVATYAFGGGNSTTLILDWITGSGAVNVTASNACGGATKPSTWSSTCREGETGTVSSITVSPNPTTGVVNVNYTATKGSTVINVLDLAGRVVMTQATSSVEGANTTQLDMSKLAKGAYMLSVQSTQGNKQIKVVVE